ncbi:cytochrome c oxidase subunit II [Sphingorhabdus pulchriflava]|uniref:Cytochrome c oxidase subunit 2 n=1 Tax=Sphingorhabdus pulchriflava TaxID=2292257 RepID=A0A371B1U2_9SPHN|nr:cytochrome c oxidase subunit II [Sphingorhabdus pulchriflava]RDV01566.1 cytochrome c oxidase subunit II [Sphingorhabdus pulchriflava]
MNVLKKLILLFGLAAMPAIAPAQAPNPAPQVAAPEAKAVPAPVAATTAATAAPAADAKAATAGPDDGSLPGYTPMKPTPGVGMPVDRGVDFQDQYSANGEYAKWLNNSILLPIITIISLFVLGLLLFVVVRFRRSANPNPSKTTHNTFIEIVWTLVPVLILLGIAYPSLTLVAKQFKPAPKEAVTVKITGYQWYWGYTYPDHGGFEVVSNMLKEQSQVGPGERYRTENDGPSHLAVDARMVVPAGVPIRIQTTAADVIHSFAVPSLWFKLDAVPGRLNEKQLLIEKPGVYFGQCSELCGARHGYMPIAVEALPPEKFAAWIKAKGGTMPGEKPAEAPAAPAAATAAAPAAAAPVAAAAAAVPAK